MQIAIVAAGFSPGEADRLRRAMATFRHVGTIHSFREKFIAGMLRNGYQQEFAERCFSQIEGFGEYGFPESHAASFALLVYVSAWIKKHYPEAFCAALLNSQPMGFYAPAQLVRDARDHGVEVRPADVNRSDWDCTLEPGSRCAAPCALACASSLERPRKLTEQIVTARGNGYATCPSVWMRSGVPVSVVERLADADAFRSDRPRPPRRTVGRQGSRRRRTADGSQARHFASNPLMHASGTGDLFDEARGGVAGDDARRARGSRLLEHIAVAESPSHRLLS